MKVSSGVNKNVLLADFLDMYPDTWFTTKQIKGSTGWSLRVIRRVFKALDKTKSYELQRSDNVNNRGDRFVRPLKIRRIGDK